MMNNKEKLPKLVDVYRASDKPLGKRQLPLVVDETLTLVMDVRSSGLICDTSLVRAKKLEEFTRKWDTLTEKELNVALQITKSELMHVLNQNVPCVGCRRSVERLYYQLFKFGYPTLDPLFVKSDGIITIREDKQTVPQVLCSIFHNHSIRLAKLIENQPKRNKKSLRCILHSLDSQRSRPLTPIWRDVWDCMKVNCKKNVCIIEAPTLHSTLETYLRKHRFCGECRTKVLRAYTLLIEEPEPCKEKGYVSALYDGIKRCLPDKHLHLDIDTDYITNLICRAEPELLGSRRERHAKTLEIAQEEVLTCLGICMYERLHRIYMRMKEEECTCQVFAAVAIDTLSRSFQTAVERKQGITQLELLYAELAREEQQKQIRKEQKKIKRKRKKNSNGAASNTVLRCGGGGVVVVEDDDEKTTNCLCINFNDNDIDNSDLWLNDECKCNNIIIDDDDDDDDEDDDEDEDEVDKNNKKLHHHSYVKCNYLNDLTTNKDGSSNNSDHSHDCGYSSENNNNYCETGSLISSISSTASSSSDGSELACSDNNCTCHHDDYLSHCRLSYGQQPSLQDMLEGYSDDDDDSDSKLTPEEVWEFENNNKQLIEKRQELREALKKKFIDFCIYGPLQVPRLLVQSKYASN